MRISRGDRNVLVDIIIDELRESNFKKRDPKLIKKDAIDKMNSELKEYLEACVELNKEKRKLDNRVTDAVDNLATKIGSIKGYRGYCGSNRSEIDKVEDYRNRDLQEHYEQIYKKKYKYADIPTHYNVEKLVLKSSDGTFEDIIESIVSSLTK
tara:strand:+ start:5688 stop:6146 length:459 start_codon:yes stop_codon:yes gene_type:complete